MLMRRILAELIDLIVFLVSGAFALKYSVQFVATIEGVLWLRYSFVILVTLGLPLLLQSFFYQRGRSIGKSYNKLVVVDEQTKAPADFYRMLVREVFCKVISIYIACIPVFFGNKGIHEISSQTEVAIFNPAIHDKVAKECED